MIKAAIFDLDGVLVDTAKYHYAAWKKLAAQFNYHLSLEENEQFKGVSRLRCMELLCEFMGIQLSKDKQEYFANLKNDEYIKSISTLDEQALLPGSKSLLETLHQHGIFLALGSASKNALPILRRLGIEEMFDYVVDGNQIQKAKPDPQVFLLGAKKLGVPPSDCVVFEDSQAGIEAAHRAGMVAVGVGTENALPQADYLVHDLSETPVRSIFEML